MVDEVDSVLIDESRNPMIISTSVAQNEEVVKLVDLVGWMVAVEHTCKCS